jgi:hypothetical protein
MRAVFDFLTIADVARCLSDLSASGVRKAADTGRFEVAAELVERHAPADMVRDKVDILRRLGLMMTNLTQHDTTALCRRCGSAFTFDASRFAAKHLDPPRHCLLCRQARRWERERAGITENVPQDDGNPAQPAPGSHTPERVSFEGQKRA